MVSVYDKLKLGCWYWPQLIVKPIFTTLKGLFTTKKSDEIPNRKILSYISNNQPYNQTKYHEKRSISKRNLFRGI